MAKRRVIFKTFHFMFSFIVTFMLVTCQIMPCFTFAQALEQPFVASDLWTVIEGGAGTDPSVPNLIKDPYIMSVELGQTFGLGYLAQQAFWEETNAEIQQKINDGTLSREDIGTIWYKEVDGVRVPIGVKNTIYGQNMYLLTDDLAYKIQQENLQHDDQIARAVSDYWERVIISDIEPFQQVAHNAQNWICTLGNTADSIVKPALWRAVGVDQSTPDPNFFQNGVAGTVHIDDDYGVYNYSYGMDMNYVNPDWDYFVMRCPNLYQRPDYEGYWAITVFYHSPTMPLYEYDSYMWQGFPGRTINTTSFSGFSSITYSFDSLKGISDPPYSVVDIRDVFANWPYVVHLPDVAPAITPGVHYNVGNIAGCNQALATATDAEVDENSSPSGDPDYTPDTRPEIDPDVMPDVSPDPYPDPYPDDFPDDFPDPDEWVDPDNNPWPDPVPDPDGPDVPDVPDGPDNPDNPDDPDQPEEQPPSRPALKVPMLLTLFPFCIPFDIKRAIEWFGSDESDPVYHIPINISLSGRSIVNTTLDIDLTDHGIRVVATYLKTVQIFAYVIVLGYATAKVIY